MQLQAPFTLFTPTVDAGVLMVLAQSESTFSATQVQRLSPVEVSPAGARRALARLVEQGIVESERHGNAFVYRLNRDHLAAPAAIALARLRQQLYERIRSTVAEWPDPPIYGAVFGSAARGTMQPASDIDLFLVRPRAAGSEDDRSESSWPELVASLERTVTAWTGNDTRVVSFTADELTGPNRPTALLEEIDRDGVPVAGDEGWLRRLLRTAGRRE
ncbi:nucleotidyltransferase domain-containing protein [Agromyces aerolatus]|uniref:nucleotidyltransferase domain-containing protein n=1 Tax=Agromyces sp. LY-1074 TaxID=3074080 RepID=UPI00285A58E6|nr:MULTISPECIES: nucleotidyltransferase domain-containing protein [unclassified Agromyces]MDR5700281.1 nucleotidyltransferase domain-containing protein [Agromyces sp. LY-1074]MDR5706741.1 nucleotidyltransferase domain-containing protein [Agromyces sp. LY-1358]